MIEIFTKASGAAGKPERSTADGVNLRTPSDVHLGTASPGIAFYEKAGADLRVTLLDGKVLMLQNFFAMGPNGEYSRLLNGEGGSVEVTGLIAPEPFVPRDDTPSLSTAVPVAAEAQPQPAESTEAPRAPVASTLAPEGAEMAETGDAAATGEAAAQDAGGFFGVSGDLLAFGAANIGLLWVGLSGKDDEPADTSGAAFTALHTPPSGDEAMSGMDSDLALLLLADTEADAVDLAFCDPSGAPEASTLFDRSAFVTTAPAGDTALYAIDSAPLAAFDDLLGPVLAI